MRRFRKSKGCSFLAAAWFILVSASSEAQPGTAAPKIGVKEPLYEFGTIAEGTKVGHDFSIVNEGAANLEIARAVPSCGCTVAAIANHTLLPGQETKIRVDFDSTGFTGPKVKTVRLFSNDPDQPSVELALKGVIQPEVSLDPKQIFFGEVTRGSLPPPAQDVWIRTHTGGLKVAGASVRSKYLTVQELESSAEGKKFRLTLDPQAPLGELRERLMVELDGAAPKAVNVPIFAAVKGPLQIHPPSLAFGIISGDQPLEREARLINKGEAAFTIKRVASNHPAVKASVEEIDAGREYRLLVQIKPSKVKRDVRAVLVVRTDHPDQKEVPVNVYGILPPKEE